MGKTIQNLEPESGKAPGLWVAKYTRSRRAPDGIGWPFAGLHSLCCQRFENWGWAWEASAVLKPGLSQLAALPSSLGWHCPCPLGKAGLPSVSECGDGFHSQFCDLLAGKLLNLFPHFYNGHSNNYGIVR